ncbi:hypothetical protein [Cellulomonas rhizosphaerae]|uniref:Uncharacterized protein n=1 Tax=Cellulomonas rhizosphaerae TaxID=2293719 RepID=A0A413RJG7_9CELL|nr:hypothetical protein [Cellulomonas rhizosphaerae]RHA38741.1 hypothetical protein D1825_13490 [Cellulomonas rhizosphaerae]
MPKTQIQTHPLDFDAWLETGTIAQRTVELHNDRSIPDQLDVLSKRREVAAAVAEAEDTEASVTEIPEVVKIDAALEALWVKWEESKETWLVRALSVDEIKLLRTRHPVEDQPPTPGKGASRGTREAHEALLKAWAERMQDTLEAIQYAQLEAAIVSITTSKGVATARGTVLDEDFRPAVTAAQLRAMHARPGRQNDVKQLLNASQDATASDVEVPAPFWQRPSSKHGQN